MKISKLYQLIGNDIVEIPLVDVEELNDRLSNIENNYFTKEESNDRYVRLDGTGNPYTGYRLVFNSPVYDVNAMRTDVIFNVSNEGEYNENDQVFITAQRYRPEPSSENTIVKQLSICARNIDGSRIDLLQSGVRASGTGWTAARDPLEGLYDNQIDTLRSSINRHPVRIEVLTSNRILYLGGANASDTADLWKGRGTSPEMPFATLPALTNFLSNFCDTGAYTPIISLLSDITITENLNISLHGGNLLLQSADENNIKTINASSVKSVGVVSGRLSLRKIGFSNIQVISYSNLAELLIAGNISVSGEMAANQDLLSANYGGRIRTDVAATVTVSGRGDSVIYLGHKSSAILSCSFTGSFTGKKFRLLSGGWLDTYGRGTNFLPGTLAGTSDEYSTYF